MPFFSVIIPVYNVEKYLSQCVQSVLTQPFKDLEAILVDDGSTDSSGEMCDDWAAQDSRVRVIHQENGGLGQARNAGLHAAKGKWILFLDSDDYWCDGCLSMLVERMQQCPEGKLYVTKWQKLDEKSGALQTPKLEVCTEGIYQYESLYNIVRFYESHCGWAVWKLVVHRSLICDQPLNFLPNVRHGEDLYWVISLFARVHQLCILDVVLCCYRVRMNGTLSELSPQNALCWMDDVASTLYWLDSEKVNDKKEILSWIANIFMYYTLLAADKHYEREWKERYTEIKRVMPFLLPINASKKARCVKLFSINCQGTWELCRLMRILLIRVSMNQ